MGRAIRPKTDKRHPIEGSLLLLPLYRRFQAHWVAILESPVFPEPQKQALGPLLRLKQSSISPQPPKPDIQPTRDEYITFLEGVRELYNRDPTQWLKQEQHFFHIRYGK